MAAISGRIVKEVEVPPNRTDVVPIGFFADLQDYVSGGVTFNFPSGLFSEVPKVEVTLVLKTLGYSTAITVTPIVTALSAASITVRVNKATVASILEAATNEVTVHVFAINDEVP